MTVPDSYFTPPDPEIYNCGCGHSNEDHADDLGAGVGPCQVDGCDCESCDELYDIHAALESEEADRRYSMMKEGAL